MVKLEQNAGGKKALSRRAEKTYRLEGRSLDPVTCANTGQVEGGPGTNLEKAKHELDQGTDFVPESPTGRIKGLEIQLKLLPVWRKPVCLSYNHPFRMRTQVHQSICMSIAS